MSAQPQTEPTRSPPILNLPEFLSPFPGRKPRGKIANLPKVQRDQINVMLLDGATYAVIIQKLAEQGVSLNAREPLQLAPGWLPALAARAAVAGTPAKPQRVCPGSPQ